VKEDDAGEDDEGRDEEEDEKEGKLWNGQHNHDEQRWMIVGDGCVDKVGREPDRATARRGIPAT
jgi:hypothetical protein